MNSDNLAAQHAREADHVRRAEELADAEAQAQAEKLSAAGRKAARTKLRKRYDALTAARAKALSDRERWTAKLFRAAHGLEKALRTYKRLTRQADKLKEENAWLGTR